MPVFNRTRIENGTNGNPCPQGIPIWARKLSGLTDYESTGTEDCLFLDIDVPKVVYDRRRRGRGAPVLVWIYGGGYTAGSKEFFGTGAGLLAVAQEPVIYVALNYRVCRESHVSPTLLIYSLLVRNIWLHGRTFIFITRRNC